MGRKSSLAEEAEVLAPLFVVWQEMHLQHSLSAQDLVAAFILAFASLRRPNAWAAGPLNTPYLPSSSPLVESSSIHSLPGLLSLLQPAYLTKKLPHLLPLSNITLYMICKSLRLYGIKKNSDDFVNVSLLQWYANMRPYTLLFHIPSPIEVLRMQADGRRVITMLLTKENLSTQHRDNLTYMDGESCHLKDCFEFLLHDMKHMEHFVFKDTHLEQVGFFRCMLSLHEKHPKNLFSSLGFDSLLWSHLEYLIADMNSYSPHLLQYLFAKLLIATKRKNEYIAITMDQDPDGVNKILPRLNRDGSEFLLLVWQRILEAFKMKEGSSLPAFEHAMQIGCISLQDDGDTVREGREDLTPEKWEIIRSFFRSKAEGNLVNDES